MKKITIIEQLSPNSIPFKATYTFDGKTGKYNGSGSSPLSKKELDFYSSPDVNERTVKHLWLDNAAKARESSLEILTQDIKANL